MLPVSLLTCQVACLVLTASAIQPLQPHALTRVCSYTFDHDNDRDLDDQPDEWVRRKGIDFPHYVKAGIDRQIGADDRSSLRIDANGAAAIYYSPIVPVDDLHTYFFSGQIRTEGLQHDAAMISISLLDHRRQRIQRVLSRPVTGTHSTWIPIELGPITPHDNVRFVVIGCHLIPGSEDHRDIGGKCWFDALALGRLPRMELESNFYRHFVSGSSPVEVNCKVSGLDPGHKYELDFAFLNVKGDVLKEQRIPLEEDHLVNDRHLTDFIEPLPVVWKLEPQQPGYYTASAKLLRDGSPIASQGTSLVILQLVEKPLRTGEFGWSIRRRLGRRELMELPSVCTQAGINLLKYPLWNVSDEENPQAATDVASSLDQLAAYGVSPVAMLSEPPAKMRRKFARNWHGVNEVFSLPTSFWQGSLEPVVARYSSSVRYWQLGGEDDTSFLGAANLQLTLEHTRKLIQRISLNAALGVPWRWDQPVPEDQLQFVSLSSTGPLKIGELSSRLAQPAVPGTERWAVMRLSQLASTDVDGKAAELAQWMLAAKIGRADRIILDEAYHNRDGLLHEDGSPGELFIPWRTMALALQDAEYLGELTFPHGSRNAVFAKEGQVVIALWNDQPCTEAMYLGIAPEAMDVWGRRKPLTTDPATGDSVISVGPTPQLIVQCSEAIARWYLAAHYAIGQAPSEYGGHNDKILLKNTFPQGVSGTVHITLPHEWLAEPNTWTIAAEKGEQLELPFYLQLPSTANLGEQMTTWEFNIVADRSYRFRLRRPFSVGLNDLKLEVFDRRLPDGRLEIEQVLTNSTNPVEKLDFRCSLFVPDSRRQKTQVTRLGNGTDRKFYYLPNAEKHRGQELWLRLEQDGGRRVINYRWKVGQDWDKNESS